MASKSNESDYQTKKTTIDVSGLFFWQVIWEILISKLGKINSFWHWEWYRLSVPVTVYKGKIAGRDVVNEVSRRTAPLE